MGLIKGLSHVLIQNIRRFPWSPLEPFEHDTYLVLTLKFSF